jgi:GT2 family glycosyltransferase
VAPIDLGLVTVVLVHWNQPDRCAATIEAFRSQGLRIAIVVVDNGSDAADFGRLREVVAAANAGRAADEDEVQLIPLGTNTGFGPAANVGFRHFLTEGQGEWVALAPHDALPQPGTLRRVIEAAEAQPKVGLACADVGDGETPVVDPYFGGMTKPAEVADGWEDADYPHGTLLVARRACLDEIGLFDERYFAYCEEADLGLRATAAGWGVGLVRGARVVNPSMRSGSPVTDYLMQRNTLLLVLDHSGPYHAFIRFNIAGFQLVRGLVQPSSRAWLFSAKGRAWAMFDFVRGHFGVPPAALFAEAGEPR